jgi:hypothetical protein
MIFALVLRVSAFYFAYAGTFIAVYGISLVLSSAVTLTARPAP